MKMDSSIEETYAKLTQMPQNQWAGAIAALDENVKKELLCLIRYRREKKNESVAIKGKSAMPSNASLLPPDTISTCSSLPPEGGHSTKHNIPPYTQQESNDISMNTSHQESVTQDFSVAKEKEGQGTAESKDVPQRKLPRNTRKKNASTKHTKIWDNLRDIMFVSGDVYALLPDSEVLMHRYLDVWLSCAVALYRSRYVKEQEGNVNKTLGQIKSAPVMPAVSIYEMMFPIEFSVFKNKIESLNATRHVLWTPSTFLKYSGVVDECEPAHHTPQCPFLTDSTTVACVVPSSTNYHTTLLDYTHKEEPVNVDAQVALHIHSPLRHEDRLKAQDIRTQSMNTLEYKRFARARENISRLSRQSITEWLSVTTKIDLENDTGSTDQHIEDESRVGQRPVVELFDETLSSLRLPPSSAKFLLFLISDRVASIIELAIRIRFFFSTNASWKDTDLNVLDASHSVLDPDTFGYNFSRVCCMYSTVVARRSGDAPAPEISEYDIHDAIAPSFYEYAIFLSMHFVDSVHFGVNVSVLKQAFLNNESETAKRLDTRTNVTRGRKRMGTRVVRNAHTVRKVIKTTQHSAVENMDKSACNSLLTDATTSQNDIDSFFDCVVRQTIERCDPPNVPEELVTFGYLKCRDLFWNHRHDTPYTLWEAIYDRYKAEQDTDQYMAFRGTYNQIVRYTQAVREIICVGDYFKSIFNVDDAQSLAMYLEKRKGTPD